MGRPPGTTVFVGNISYETTEEQLKEVFSQVGNVLSFRLMYDHETGKAKGFGFCEYEDKETAMSARRNLNGTDLNGRSLRVDLTENDKQMAAAAAGGAKGGGTGGGGNRRGGSHPALQGGLGGPNPSMARMTPREIHDAMLTLKRAVESNPNEIRELLLAQPMHAHAILQGQIMLGMVPPPPMMRPPALPPPPPHAGAAGAHMPQIPPQMNAQMAQQMVPPHIAQQMAPQMSQPPAAQMAAQMPGMVARPGLMPSQMPGAPPPPQGIVPQQMGAALPQLQSDEAHLLATVMNMTPLQISRLPPDQRDKVLQLQTAVHSQQQGMGDMAPGGMRAQPPQRPYR